MKYYLIFIIFTLISCTDSSTLSSSIFPLTKTKIQDLLDNPPDRPPQLKEETISGCISVPATRFFQRLFVGSKSTGESCSITVHSDNTISVSFLDQTDIPSCEYQHPESSYRYFYS